MGCFVDEARESTTTRSKPKGCEVGQLSQQEREAVPNSAAASRNRTQRPCVLWFPAVCIVVVLVYNSRLIAAATTPPSSNRKNLWGFFGGKRSLEEDADGAAPLSFPETTKHQEARSSSSPQPHHDNIDHHNPHSSRFFSSFLNIFAVPRIVWHLHPTSCVRFRKRFYLRNHNNNNLNSTPNKNSNNNNKPYVLFQGEFHPTREKNRWHVESTLPSLSHNRLIDAVSCNAQSLTVSKSIWIDGSIMKSSSTSAIGIARVRLQVIFDWKTQLLSTRIGLCSSNRQTVAPNESHPSSWKLVQEIPVHKHVQLESHARVQCPFLPTTEIEYTFGAQPSSSGGGRIRIQPEDIHVHWDELNLILDY